MNIVEHPLPFWQDPQNHVISEHVRDTLRIAFKCWNEDATEADNIAALVFENVVCVELLRHTRRYLPKKPKYRSSILEIRASHWLADIVEISDREAAHPAGATLRHYAVHSHDHQIQVLATGFRAANVTAPESVRLRALWDAA
jgi:hypothetical protein